MKKVLLTMVCLVAFTIVKAQVDFVPVWDETLELPRTYADAKSNDLMAFDATGSLYATGLFNKEFTFGNAVLENSANSTYLIKFGADGTKLWGVSFYGAATPTAITTDIDNNVYVAGTLADEVVFKSTDATEITKKGILKDGEPVVFQGAGFVAKYASDGRLLGVETFIPEPLDGDLTDYSPIENKSIGFNISGLVFYDGTIYASALLGGILESNGITLRGSYSAPFWGAWHEDCDAGFVVALDANTLKMKNEVASQRTKEADANSIGVKQISLTESKGKLFVSFIGIGEATLTVNGQSQQADFPYEIEFTDGMEVGYFAKGCLITSIDLSTGDLLSHKMFASDKHDIYSIPFNYVAGMYVADSELILAGSFTGVSPFDDSVIAENSPITSSKDFYAVSLDISDFSVNNLLTAAAKKPVRATVAVVSNDLVIAYGYDSDNLYYEFIASLAENQYSIEESGSYYTGLASRDGKVSLTEVSNLDEATDTGNLNFIVTQTPGGTSLSSSTKDAGVSVYPNPVVDELNFTSPCDVVITNLVGITVKQAENVINLNVADLAGGHYLVKVSTDEGTNTVKVIKK